MIDCDARLRRGSFELDARLRWAGGVLGVTGPSGCGKTTLLHVLAGLARPDAGELTVGGERFFDSARRVWAPPHRRRVAVVFQDDRLLPGRTVESNLLFGYRRTPRAERRLHPPDLIDPLELGPLLRRRAGSLSGGEKRRVGLARALLTSPRLLLLDEPTNGLHPAMCDAVLDLLADALERCGAPAIVVSHRLDHLVRLTDDLAVMRGGRIVHRGSSATLFDHDFGSGDFGEPLNRFDATVLRHLFHQGVTELTIHGAGEGFTHPLRAPLTPRLVPGQRATVLLSADQVVLSLAPVETVSMQNRLRGRLVAVRASGSGVRCTIDVGAPLTASITRQARDEFQVNPGRPIWCLFKASALRVYPAVEPSSPRRDGVLSSACLPTPRRATRPGRPARPMADRPPGDTRRSDDRRPSAEGSPRPSHPAR